MLLAGRHGFHRWLHSAASQLARLGRLVGELQKTTSIRTKFDLLRSYPDMRDILLAIYSPHAFGLTSSVLERPATPSPPQGPAERIPTLDALVEGLCSQAFTRADGKARLRAFAGEHAEHLGLVKMILDKNLKVRLGRALLCRAYSLSPFPAPRSPAPASAASLSSGLDFPVALGEQMGSLAELKSFLRDSIQIRGERWLVSRKIDGVRCIARVAHEPFQHITLRTRRGRLLSNLESFKVHLDHLLRLPAELGGQPVYIDGELAWIDRLDSDAFRESFQATMSIVLSQSRPSGLPDHLVLFVFDCLTEDELVGRVDTPLSRRLARLAGLQAPFDQRVFLLPQHALAPPDDPSARLDSLIREQLTGLGWEGVIIRRDAPYVGRRSRDIQKLKLFRDAEFRVLDIELAPMRFVCPEAGRDQEDLVLKSVVIEHRQNRVSVGSGFSLQERRQFAAQPDLIVGKRITVKYFEESFRNDPEPRWSLRFPVFKAICRG